jgi:filamentous hemagglutinin
LGAALTQATGTTHDITLGTSGSQLIGTAVVYPAGAVFSGATKSLTIGATPLVVGATAGNAVSIVNAVLTTGGSGADGDITLVHTTSGTVTFAATSGSVTGSLKLNTGGVLTTYGTGNVTFATKLTLETSTTTGGDVGTFTASTGPVTFKQDGANAASITGEATNSGSKLTLAGANKAQIRVGDNTYAVTATDIEIDVSNGVLKLGNAPTFVLAANAGSGHSVAKLTLSGTSKWIASGASTSVGATGAGFEEGGTGAAISSTADITIASVSANTDATNDAKINVGSTAGGTLGGTGGAGLTVGSGASPLPAWPAALRLAAPVEYW